MRAVRLVMPAVFLLSGLIVLRLRSDAVLGDGIAVPVVLVCALGFATSIVISAVRTNRRAGPRAITHQRKRPVDQRPRFAS
jgi:hypothetical protein